MKLINLKKVKDGKYLKNYELTYLNKANKEKTYEIVSHKELTNMEQLGAYVSGVSIVCIYQDKLLLLKEFRMAVNQYVYNLCAGMKEPNETIEECVRRELYEETGLNLIKIDAILPPAFAAVSLSDIQNQLVFVQVDGEITDHTSENEDIKAAFYTREEISKLLETEVFSSRAQAIAYFFAKGDFN